MSLGILWNVMKRILATLLIIVGFVHAFFNTNNVTSKIPCVVTRVVDGDTFHCKLQGGKDVKVRLIGVDTPESSYNSKTKRDAKRSEMSIQEIMKMGKMAAEFTKMLIHKGDVVYLEFDVVKTDKYGRLLSYVWLKDGRMLNELLIKEGYAKVYTIPPNVKYQERFIEAQRYARENRKGVWKLQ